MQPFQVLRKVSTDLQDDILVIRILPAQMLDEQSEEVRREIAAVINEFRPQRVVLDLSQVAMISSTGVSVAISVLRRLHEQGGELVLCSLAPIVEQVFRLCRLISSDPKAGVFQACPDVESAVAVLRAKS